MQETFHIRRLHTHFVQNVLSLSLFLIRLHKNNTILNYYIHISNVISYIYIYKYTYAAGTFTF